MNPPGKIKNVHPSQLSIHPGNPRQGNVAAIAASLRANGLFKPLLVNAGTHTGRAMEVLAGNHTLMAVRDLAEQYPDDERWQKIPVWTIDVDEDRAKRMVLADNKTHEGGGYDERLLAEMMADLPDLEGTGYDEDELADLVALLQEQDEPTPAGDPAPGPGKDKSQFGDDGMGNNLSLDSMAKNYEQMGTRIVMLSYSLDQFTWLQARLEELGKERGQDSNASIVLAIVAELTGQEAPEATAPVVEISE